MYHNISSAESAEGLGPYLHLILPELFLMHIAGSSGLVDQGKLDVLVPQYYTADGGGL
jgi:hypothetical protein